MQSIFRCERANQLVWELLNGRLVQRSATTTTKPSQIQLAREIPFDHPECGKTLLVLDGMRLRQNARGRIPLIFGNEKTVRGIVGSVLAIVVIKRVLYGQAYFVSDTQAQAIAQRWNAGEISHDVTLEFSVNSGNHVPAGKSFRGYPGPFFVAAEWSPTAVRIQA